MLYMLYIFLILRAEKPSRPDLRFCIINRKC